VIVLPRLGHGQFFTLPLLFQTSTFLQIKWSVCKLKSIMHIPVNCFVVIEAAAIIFLISAGAQNAV
jgi:hypothetical protein